MLAVGEGMGFSLFGRRLDKEPQRAIRSETTNRMQYCFQSDFELQEKLIDKEFIESNPTSHPQNQKGKKHLLTKDTYSDPNE